MGGNVGKRILILLALALVGMFVIACNDSSEASDAVNTAAPTNPGPTQVVLGDGPVGVAGSRFTDPDVEINLTAEVVDWDKLDGKTVEIWGYDGQYPSPAIRATVGDKVRVNLTNDLPEAATIHWHGLEVPNDQVGVPGITQRGVQPGETWTYEFIAPKGGTAMYHTHSNTIIQLSKGLFGSFIIEPKGGLPQYDRQYTLMLHEMQGLYPINGHSFPKTLEDDLLKIRTGEKVLLRMINVRQFHHPMHLHGYQFKLVQLDGNPVTNPIVVNTQDIAPGQTVDVEVIGSNPARGFSTATSSLT